MMLGAFEIGWIHSRIEAGFEEKTFKESFLLKRHPTVSNDLRPLLMGWTTLFFPGEFMESNFFKTAETWSSSSFLETILETLFCSWARFICGRGQESRFF